MIHAVISLLFMLSLSASASFIPETSGATKISGDILFESDEVSGVIWKLATVPQRISVPAKWDDMEAMATVDDKLFFATTSHSLTKKGNRRPEREQLFLLSYDGNITVRKTWSLRDHILDVLERQPGLGLVMSDVRALSPVDGGLNIEGMTWAQGKLFLGLRAPLTNNGEAIILQVKNALTNPEVERVHVLPLNGKGVRGLETKNDQIMVLSGSVDDTDMLFDLDLFYPASGTVLPLHVPEFHSLERPESLVAVDGGILFFQDFEAPRGQDEIIRLGY